MDRIRKHHLSGLQADRDRCDRRGRGVVTRDVEDFAIVAGNPARLIRRRSSEETRRRVLESLWWEKPVEKLVKHLDAMNLPLDDGERRHPLLCASGGGNR